MSALKQRITDEMKAALLGGDRFRGDVLRNFKAVILNEEVALGKRDEGLADTEIEKLIAKEVKKRQESIELYRHNNREDLAEIEDKELAILKEYMPEQMSDDEIRQIANSVVAEIGEVTMQQMGQVIGAVKSKAGNAADGATVAKIVKEVLTK